VARLPTRHRHWRRVGSRAAAQNAGKSGVSHSFISSGSGGCSGEREGRSAAGKGRGSLVPGFEREGAVGFVGCVAEGEGVGDDVEEGKDLNGWFRRAKKIPAGWGRLFG